METRRSNTAWISLLAALALPALLLGACKPNQVHGIVVARFMDRPGTLRKKIDIPASGQEREIDARFEHRDVSCDLKIYPPPEPQDASTSCKGISGLGELLCSDGQKLRLGWTSASCDSGFGRNLDRSNPPFVFGFGRNLDRALDRLQDAINVAAKEDGG